jgi:hypothetical protein
LGNRTHRTPNGDEENSTTLSISFSFFLFLYSMRALPSGNMEHISTPERALACSQNIPFNEVDVQNLRKSADDDCWTKICGDPVAEEIRAAFATNDSKAESDKARFTSAEKWKQTGDAIYGQWLAGDRLARQQPKQRLDSSAQARLLKQALHAYTEVDPHNPVNNEYH